MSFPSTTQKTSSWTGSDVAVLELPAKSARGSPGNAEAPFPVAARRLDALSPRGSSWVEQRPVVQPG